MEAIAVTMFCLGGVLALVKAGDILAKTSMSALAEGIALCLGYSSTKERLKGHSGYED